MLKKRAADFAEQVWVFAARMGNNAPRIADELLRSAFPVTLSAAEDEGAAKMLRTGVVSEVKRILKSAPDPHEQHDFASIDPAFQSIVSELKSRTYFVERADEYVAVPRLIADPGLLDDARRHMRRKGEECLAEAKRLDELYAAVTGGPLMPRPSSQEMQEAGFTRPTGEAAA